ncbi:IclR family transcriptional regulator [Dethiosulfatarculus sandiegensis]|uniref:IclR family transcriptional regulator n=1 Tax=Dethiosulfatarculus sandiegensis TaxID=1429043 RepID=A0A0D2J4P0_9BACT|nr:IclR family transcriptional regulator [Dethiosulfatarculus sandiegensis]KIX13079.1 hypothetical protein X474_16065 [Dethiosulfatarculus sandiegensis]
MTPNTKQAERHVEAVLAAIEMLDCFQNQPHLTTKELMDLTGFTRNRVTRLAGTLEHKNYLISDPSNGSYSLGPRVMILGKVYERSQSLLTLARPILKELVAQTGECASLYVREGLERVVMAREEGTRLLRFSVTEGQRMEIHAGAGGKVLLAFAPKNVQERLFKQTELKKLTKSTISDPQKLKKELEQIREAKIAVSLAERSNEAGAIAGPVFDQNHRLVGALALAGPAARIANLIETNGKQIITKAAQKLSAQLGHSKKT